MFNDGGDTCALPCIYGQYLCLLGCNDIVVIWSRNAIVSVVVIVVGRAASSPLGNKDLLKRLSYRTAFFG